MLCSGIKIDIFIVPSSENNILIFYNSQMEQGNNPRLGSLMIRSVMMMMMIINYWNLEKFFLTDGVRLI